MTRVIRGGAAGRRPPQCPSMPGGDKRDEFTAREGHLEQVAAWGGLGNPSSLPTPSLLPSLSPRLVLYSLLTPTPLSPPLHWNIVLSFKAPLVSISTRINITTTSPLPLIVGLPPFVLPVPSPVLPPLPSLYRERMIGRHHY